MLLPLDPDASAERIRAAFPAGVAVLVSDSFGRPFRQGITGVAIGSAGIEPLDDRIGSPDDAGRPFAGTVVHVADELAAIADHVMGPAGGVPAVRIRGARAYAGRCRDAPDGDAGRPRSLPLRRRIRLHVQSAVGCRE